MFLNRLSPSLTYILFSFVQILRTSEERIFFLIFIILLIHISISFQWRLQFLLFDKLIYLVNSSFLTHEQLNFLLLQTKLFILSNLCLINCLVFFKYYVLFKMIFLLILLLIDFFVKEIVFPVSSFLYANPIYLSNSSSFVTHHQFMFIFDKRIHLVNFSFLICEQFNFLHSTISSFAK